MFITKNSIIQQRNLKEINLCLARKNKNNKVNLIIFFMKNFLLKKRDFETFFWLDKCKNYGAP